MCIYNINANILCCKNKEYISDDDLLKHIEMKKNSKGRYIDDFMLKIYFNFISSKDEVKRQLNVLDNKGTLKCKVTFEKICDNNDSLYIDLMEFDINLTNRGDFYLNQIININVGTPIYLPQGEEEGNYLFNLELKRKFDNYEDSEWTLQSVYGIQVEKAQ